MYFSFSVIFSFLAIFIVGLLEFVQLAGGDDRCQDGGTGNHEKEAVEFLGFSSDGLAVASEMTQSFLVCHA